LSTLVVGLTACGGNQSPPCSSCPGCCDSTGACLPGNTAAACGKNGAACSACSGSVSCVAGACDTSTCTSSSCKRVFITSHLYHGGLKVTASTATGVLGGDKLCGDLATAAGLGGTWKAWLSEGPSTNAIDRIADVGPWYLVGKGTKVFENKAGLAGPALAAISMDEKGVGAIDLKVWTGTNTGGTANKIDCGGWSTINTPNMGSLGNAGDKAQWTQATGVTQDNCSASHALICFEQ
jgi:hypothetical protein